MDIVPLEIVYDNSIIEAGDTTSITLKAKNTTSLSQFNLSFKYDPANFTLENAALNTKFTTNGIVENADGTVSVNATLKDNEPMLSGDIDMLVITLKAKNIDALSPLTILRGTNLSNANTDMYTLSTDIVNNIAIANSKIHGEATVNIADLVSVAQAYGKTTNDTGYSTTLDMNKDGVIDIIDIAYVAAKILGR
jgi:hypothetical protein